MPAIQNFVSTAFTDIKNIWEQNLKPALEAIGDFIENVLAPVFKFVFETIIAPVVEGAFKGIVDLWNNSLKPGLQAILDFVKNVFSGDFSGAFSSLVDAISSIWSGISGVIKAPLNAVIGIVNSFIGKINRLEIPEWVPGIGGKGLDIPEIPLLERGGVLERGQVGFLEGNGAEAVVPLHQNKAWISAVARDMDTAMGGTSSNQVTSVLLDILAAVEELLSAGIYLDTGALVGGLAKPMDRRLGQIQAAKARA
jgi:phage-related protein